MNSILTSDFQTLATAIASLVFPKTQFQFFCREIGRGKVSMTFKNIKDFSENFRVKFFSTTKEINICGYSEEGIIQLKYLPENNYKWYDANGSLIEKPSCIGDKFEFLSKKFYTFFQEFYVAEVVDDFSSFKEFENAATKVAGQAFPQFTFRVIDIKKGDKELYFDFEGSRSVEEKIILKTEPESFHKKASILFNIDFRSHAKRLAINTIWDCEKYLLFYNANGYLSWSKLHLDNINPPLGFGQEFEMIAIQLYPLLQEFFPG